MPIPITMHSIVTFQMKQQHTFGCYKFLLAAITLLIIVLLGSCTDRGRDRNNSEPELGSVFPNTEYSTRRVGVVYSDNSASNFYDGFDYRQLFAAMQNQSLQAGIPYDLLTESDLLNTDLLQYDVLLFPDFTSVQSSNRVAIENTLVAAQQAGVSILASGEFMTQDQNGQSFSAYTQSLERVLGLRTGQFLSSVSADITVARNDHPLTDDFTEGELLHQFNRTWFAEFEAAPGESSLVLLDADVLGSAYPATQIILRAAPVVHFANVDMLADMDFVWRVVQWLGHQATAPVSLQVTRHDAVFIARNDMDQAMQRDQIDETEIPLLGFIEDWKSKYNFVGSYYIDIGNNPELGQFTDWSLSGPLYQDYIALGNEIGTHSWTHPHFTSELSDNELEFEFNQSRQEISDRLGITVTGGAVPGNAESLRVVNNLNQWFDYFSGRSGTTESGFQTAIGFLQPDHDMMYFSLNMSPDFTLINFLRRTPQQAEDRWRDEMDWLVDDARLPILHWLWHDYGPTTETNRGNYSVEMFENTIAYARDLGSEFVTLDDLQRRIRSFSATTLHTGFDGNVRATVAPADGDNVGQFALALENNLKIKSVDNWYAYDDSRVLLPEIGGDFIIRPGDDPDDNTRLSALPMRARLLNVTGDGQSLAFQFSGEGEAKVTLHSNLAGNVSVSGADNFSEDNGELTLTFNENTEHYIQIEPIVPVNNAPSALPSQVATAFATPVDITLTGSDPDGDSLSFAVTFEPLHGELTGSAPNLVFTPQNGFSGQDSLRFVVSDGDATSAEATVSITVSEENPPNNPPVANAAVYETLVESPLSIQLTGQDADGHTLTYQVLSNPANGVVNGVPPILTYTPFQGFSGTDVLTFVVNDGFTDSATARLTINVVEQTSEPNNTVSNTLTESVVIDGTLSEWSDTESFASDADDVSGLNNIIDLSVLTLAHDENNLYISYELHDEATLTWGNQLYIDTDTDITTGFRGFSSEYIIGADYLLESGSLLKYTGTDNSSWSWEYLGQVSNASQGKSVEVSLPLQSINNPTNLWLIMLGNSTSTGGDAVDLYPDNAGDSNSLERLRRFSYTLSDSSPDGRAPYAFSQSLNTSRNAQLPIVLSGADENNDPLTFQISEQPSQGTLTGTPPQLTYTPDGEFVGIDTFSFTVNDGQSSSNPANVQINVVDSSVISAPPQALSQRVSAVSGQDLAIVLQATDQDNDELTFRVEQSPVNGVLSGNPPDLVYTSATEFTGIDQFTFVADDGSSQSAEATVVIEVSDDLPNNTAPVANDNAVTVAFETAEGISLTGSDADGDSLLFEIVSPPALGEITGTLPDITYVPFDNISGADSFQFRVNDGLIDSEPATVTIDILPPVVVNQPPMANGQTYSTQSATPIAVNLSGADPEGAPLSFSLQVLPENGVLSGTAPDLIYTPDNGFAGVDTFTFNVSDGVNVSANAVITIDVTSNPSMRTSNPLTTPITLDAQLQDWNGLTAFAADPDDITGPSNPLDWREAWVAHDSSNLYIAYRNDGVFTQSWGSAIYIDTDSDPTTGFSGFNSSFPSGAEILIESGYTYVYTGSGSNWSWAFTGGSQIASAGAVAELSIPLSVLNGSTSITLYFRANNQALGGSAIDHYPDTAVNPDLPYSERVLTYDLQ